LVLSSNITKKIVNATTDKVTRSVTEEVNQKLSEKEDQEARKLNLIVHNLPETGSKQGDIDSVTELFQEEFRLKMNVVNAQRMGRPNNDNTRLVKVTMNNVSDKKQILALAKDLRESTHAVHSKIYIRPDLTKLQLEESKNLRETLKTQREKEPDKRWMIRRGRVVEIK